MIVGAKKEVSSNIQDAVDFKISTDAHKLFSMLGTYLYSNKEFAVAYELSTNAVDEHAVSGKSDVPFQITFPTSFDSYLRFRDFGRGLSEENVYRFLCTYGESDKNRAESLVGGFGIGFKSIAAVSETWNIRSYHGGFVTEYLVFINEEGNPAIKKLVSLPSDETGLEIVIPVHSSRFSHWSGVIFSLYKHFPVRPTIINKEVRYENIDWKGKDWVFTERSSDMTFVSSFREYKANKEKLKEELPKHLVNMLGLQLLIKFNVSDLPKSLSREEIQYTKTCIHNITKKLQSIYDELKASYVAATTTAANGLEYRVSLSAWLHSSFLELDDYYSRSRYQALCNEIITGNTFGVADVYTDLTTYRFGVSQQQVVTNKLCVHGVVKNTTKYVDRGFNAWNTKLINYDRNEDFSINLKIVPNTAIVIVDCHDGKARAKYAANSGHPSFVDCKYIVFSNTDVFSPELSAKKIMASTLCAAPKAARTAISKSIIDSEIYVRHSGNVRFNKVEESAVSDKALWVVIKNVATGMYEVTDAESRIISMMCGRGYSLYGAKSVAAFPTGAKTPTEVANELISACERDNILDIDSAIRSLQSTTIHWICEQTYRTPLPSVFNKVSDLVKSIRDVSRKESSPNSAGLYTALCDIMQHQQVAVTDYKTSLVTALVEFDKTYPLTAYLNAYSRDDKFKKSFYEYVVGVGV